MPRQNFLSRESFVSASEQMTRESILAIPVFAPHIKLQTENKMLQNFRFIFEQAELNLEYYIDVMILPLNEQYTRISLHARHTDGQAFQHDPEMAMALHDFESAIIAALNGDTALYQPSSQMTKKSKNFLRSVLTMFSSITLFPVKKKIATQQTES